MQANAPGLLGRLVRETLSTPTTPEVRAPPPARRATAMRRASSSASRGHSQCATSGRARALAHASIAVLKLVVSRGAPAASIAAKSASASRQQPAASAARTTRATTEEMPPSPGRASTTAPGTASIAGSGVSTRAERRGRCGKRGDVTSVAVWQAWQAWQRQTMLVASATLMLAAGNDDERCKPGGADEALSMQQQELTDLALDCSLATEAFPMERVITVFERADMADAKPGEAPKAGDGALESRWSSCARRRASAATRRSVRRRSRRSRRTWRTR